MRIGFFTECYQPTINGVVTSMETFKKELTKKGHQVFIFAPQHPKALKQPDVFRLPATYLPSYPDYPLTWPRLDHLIPLAQKLKLEIIHTQHIFLMGGLGQQLARQLHLPTLHTYHTMMTEYTHYLPKIFRFLAKKAIIFRSRQFCNRTDLVIVPSTPIVEVLRGYGVKKPIEVLPTGIELKQFRKLDEQTRYLFLKKYHLPPEKKILLFVGRLAEEKNLLFLLECFQKITKQSKDAHLVLVGSGPLEPIIRKEIERLGLVKKVILTGFLPKPETNKFFGTATLFLFPSTTETQGIVLVESLASGTPAIAVDALGPKDIILDHRDGFLVPLNQKIFVEKTLLLLKDEKMRRRFEENAQQDARRFAIGKITDRLIQIYDALKDSHQKG